jgi:anti-sigma factor RsiW
MRAMNHASYTEQLSAMLDAELAPADMAELTVHLAACPDCTQHLAELAALRAALHHELPEEEVSPDFYAKISGLLDQQTSTLTPEAKVTNVLAFRPHPVRRRIGWIAAGTAIAAMLMILLLPHRDVSRDLISVRDATLRGSVSQAVASNIAGPTVVGFRLDAVRSDIVAGHPAQVLTYARANQTVTICIWSANGEPAHDVRNAVYRGMAISYWNNGKQEYWAATTGPTATLNDFVTEWRRLKI